MVTIAPGKTTKFFQFLFGEGIMERLARDYPSPRRRHYVPL